MIRKLVRFLLPRSILMALGGFFMNRMMSIFMNSMGTMALVAYSSAMNLFSTLLSVLSWIIMIGLYLSAIHQEEGRAEKGKRILKWALGLTMGLITAASATMFFLPHQLIQLYGYPSEIVNISISYLKGFAITSFAFSLLFLLIGQRLRTYSYASVLVPGVLLLLAGIVIMYLVNYIWHLGMYHVGLVHGALQSVIYIMPFVFIPVKLYSTAFIPQQEEALAPAQAE